MLAPAAADLIENQQREMEALRQANEGLRYPMIYTPEEIAKLQGDLIQRNAELLRAREELKDLYSRIDQEGNCAEPQCDEICRAALETFGKSSQMQVAIEEMSELTKELCKNGRGQENTTHIAEEIADVEIMLRQMVMLFDCAGQVDEFRRYKLERLAERIEGGEAMSMSDIASIIWIALAVYVFCGMRKWNRRFAELYEELKREVE